MKVDHFDKGREYNKYFSNHNPSKKFEKYHKFNEKKYNLMIEEEFKLKS